MWTRFFVARERINPLSGEAWKRLYQLGKETVEGTPVPATRKVYGTGAMKRDRAQHIVEAQTGNRAMNVDAKIRNVMASGTLVQPLSADELVEWLLMGVQGGITPTTVDVSAKLWTFKAVGATLDSGTMEFEDGSQNWQYNGVKVNTISIAGKPDADTTVTVGFMARNGIAATQTAALADRAIDVIEGWETQLFIDAFGGTAGTTNIPATLLDWKVDFTNNMKEKYFADNTTAVGAIITGKLGLKAELTLEADASAITEYTNRETAIKRLIRLQFGNNVLVGSTTAKKLVSIDVPCVCGAIDITTVENETAVYKFAFEYVNDPTNGFPLQVRCQNTRATAY
jgi:hypothetical protein